METLGRYIQERRARAGLRGDELAYRIGRAPSWLSRLENGGMRSLPEPDVLRGLADELGCTVPDLLAAAGYLTPEETTRRVTANPFPPDDIRHRVVERMKRVDLNGPDHAEWMGHFALQLRFYRSVERYGRDDDADLLDLDPSPYTDHASTPVDEVSRGIG